MTKPEGIGAIDCMISFPAADFTQYDFIRNQLKDTESTDFEFPVEYMFKGVPKELYGSDDPIALTLGEMDKYGIEIGLIGCEGEVSQQALRDHPERFIAQSSVDPNDVVGAVRKIRREHDEFNTRSVGAFPAGCVPQVAIDDPKFYPVYATCCELDLPIFVCAGVPGPRLPMSPQHVERIDQVMYDFPELTFVTRHGCEPWEDLAVKLMLKWPGLHYSTSRREGPLRRLLPDGSLDRAHHDRDEGRAVPRPRLGAVPARQRPTHPEARLTVRRRSRARWARPRG
jgi:predicted TIM-barrel fold metal-dependent hydrolase